MKSDRSRNVSIEEDREQSGRGGKNKIEGKFVEMEIQVHVYMMISHQSGKNS